VPDRYNREGTHFVTLANNRGQHVVWEIEPLARDRVTLLEIGYWVNKMLAAPSDRVAFEIGRLELQRVDPDHHTGWTFAPGKIAFSHTAIRPASRRRRSRVIRGERLRGRSRERFDGRVLRKHADDRTPLGSFSRWISPS
jgi:hypothetical protein